MNNFASRNSLVYFNYIFNNLIKFTPYFQWWPFKRNHLKKLMQWNYKINILLNKKALQCTYYVAVFFYHSVTEAQIFVYSKKVHAHMEQWIHVLVIASRSLVVPSYIDLQKLSTKSRDLFFPRLWSVVTRPRLWNIMSRDTTD